MKTLIQCPICHKRGDKQWASWHRETFHNFNFREEDEPPNDKTNLGIRARGISSFSVMARRFKEFGSLWSSDWDIPVTRDVLSYRRHLILEAISKEG